MPLDTSDNDDDTNSIANLFSLNPPNASRTPRSFTNNTRRERTNNNNNNNGASTSSRIRINRNLNVNNGGHNSNTENPTPTTRRKLVIARRRAQQYHQGVPQPYDEETLNPSRSRDGPSSSSSSSTSSGTGRHPRFQRSSNNNNSNTARSSRRSTSASGGRHNLPPQGPLFSPNSPRLGPAATLLPSPHNLITNVTKVLETSADKYLPKIFRFLNWNELLIARVVCKRWLHQVSNILDDLKDQGIIVIKDGVWPDQFQLFTESPVTWRKFRIEAKIYIDMVDPVQLGFWLKHGDKLKRLEIRNKSMMTLNGLIEILSRCPNLQEFRVNWTPEMYPFNVELIKRYYGINFYNATFSSMKDFGVERSCYLNDSALMCMLKWFGGGLRRISLTYPREDEGEDQGVNPLSRLKPRWTIEPLKTYVERFGYTGNLQYLDFSWSNLASGDLKRMGEWENLRNLKGFRVNWCEKLGDEGVGYFLERKGQKLEELGVAGVKLTEKVVDRVASLPNLKLLDISGPSGNFDSLTTLFSKLPSLETFSASETRWLDYSKLMPALKLLKASEGQGAKQCQLKSLNISGGIKVDGKMTSKVTDNNMNRVWFTNLAITLGHLKTLNLNGWGVWGKNDNFRTILINIPNLEELRVKGWKELGDEGVTGLGPEKLHNNKKVLIGSKEVKERVFIGSLKNLRILDLSNTGITDASIQHGINYLQGLRKFGFDATNVSESGLKMLIQKNKSLDKISCEGMGINSPVQREDGRYVHIGPV